MSKHYHVTPLFEWGRRAFIAIWATLQKLHRPVIGAKQKYMAMVHSHTDGYQDRDRYREEAHRTQWKSVSSVSVQCEHCGAASSGVDFECDLQTSKTCRSTRCRCA